MKNNGMGALLPDGLVCLALFVFGSLAVSAQGRNHLEGIPASALKVSANVLAAKFSMNVPLRDGKLQPASVGDLRRDKHQ